MMKTKHLFPIVLTALALGACSDDNVAPGSENNGVNGGSGTSDAGYVTLRIGLPSVQAGRANDDFEDGTPQEYAVKDAALLVFEKADTETEAQATFIRAYDLKDLKPWQGNEGNQNVTVSASMTAEVPALQTPGEKRYALVVLNRNSLLTIDQNTGEAKVGSEPIVTFGNFLNAVSLENVAQMTTNGLYMANAPLFDTNTNVDYTLINIEGRIYDTEAEAKRNEAVNVYVERGMAKVTLGTKFSGSVKNTDLLAYEGDQVELLAWGLDVTNKSSKMVRDVSGDTGWDYWVGTDIQNANPTNPAADKSRFWGTVTGPKRIYWGIDGNYDTDITSTEDINNNFNRVGNTDIIFDKFGSENPIYCFENTFDVARQKQTQTTRVVFKAKYNPGETDTDGTFYQVGGGTSTYTTAKLKELVCEAVMKAPGLGASIGIFDVAANNVQVFLPTEKGTVNGGTYIMAGTGSVQFHWYKVDGQFVDQDTYGSASGTKEEGDSTLTNEQLQAIDSYMGAMKYYKAGESYYSAMIKHFGDTDCPWIEGSNPAYGTAGTPESDAAYLGRYGVLRNNWYELNVTSISGPGSPDVPSLPDEWDDEASQYINVQVNVLSWAKRTQNVEL